MSSIDMANLTRTAAGSTGANQKDSERKTDGTLNGSFQKLLESRVRIVDQIAPIRGRAELPVVPKEKGEIQRVQPDETSKTGTKAGTQTEAPSEQEAQGETADVEQVILEGLEEQSRRLVDSGILAEVAEAVYVPQMQVQEMPEEEIVQTAAPILAESDALPVLGQPVEAEPVEELPQTEQAVIPEQEQPQQAEEQPQFEVRQEVRQPEQSVHHEVRIQHRTQPAEEQAVLKEELQIETSGEGGTIQPLFHDVKAAPVKVGESFTPEQTQAEDVNTQISDQVIPALNLGETKVELQLTPATLGTVKVEITQGVNGTLHIAITAQSSQTRNLLEKHMDSLQTILAQRSQTAVQVEVQRQEESQRRQDNPYDGHNGHNAHQQQEQRHPQHSRDSRDFMHQLRLGLLDDTDEDE